MTVIHWVRHAPTHARSFVGHRDVPADLSDVDQIARLSAALPRDALVVSSDLSRAIETANALQDSRARLPHRPGLREFDFGEWDGLHFSEVAEHWPDLSRRYWEQPGDVAPPVAKAGTPRVRAFCPRWTPLLKHILAATSSLSPISGPS